MSELMDEEFGQVWNFSTWLKERHELEIAEKLRLDAFFEDRADEYDLPKNDNKEE